MFLFPLGYLLKEREENNSRWHHAKNFTLRMRVLHFGFLGNTSVILCPPFQVKYQFRGKERKREKKPSIKILLKENTPFHNFPLVCLRRGGRGRLAQQGAREGTACGRCWSCALTLILHSRGISEDKETQGGKQNCQ